MATWRPFCAVRPDPSMAKEVAALPYDVMNSREAAEMVKDHPASFLHVDRAEIDLPRGTDPYSDAVYERAAQNLAAMVDQGILIKDPDRAYYIYREIMGERSQTGIVGCASVDDYNWGVIKRHEKTVAAKEEDRIRHVDACNANTGPIFLTFRSGDEIEAWMDRVVREQDPLYDFTSEDGVRHSVWKVSDPNDLAFVERYFAQVPHLYIADGHHRAASAVKVGTKRRGKKAYLGDEEFNFFLAVAFPAKELDIWDYNRVVKDLNHLTLDTFLDRVRESFKVRHLLLPSGKTEEDLKAVKPNQKHRMSMYLKGQWYALQVKETAFDPTDRVGSLDVSLLQNLILEPILGIDNPRTSSRIDFVGGIRGLGDLVRRVDGGDAVAFALYPTSIEDLMSIADEGGLMPPKSTWFEPKLRSGLFIHELS